jgi:indolepyruvate ferredoxin oxidoreductase
MKRLRGTLADPFRWAEVRKLERAMIPEFEQALDTLMSGLDADNLDDAVEIATLPDQVRGYEHIKLERAKQYRAELADRLKRYRKR